jgi:hypothetical protein
MKNGNEGMSNFVEIENLHKQIEELKKELALVREDAQVEYLRMHLRIKDLEQINKEHQDLNGKLQIELNRHLGDT